MIITRSKYFVKAYNRLPKNQQEQIDTALLLLVENPFNPKLKNHSLKGEYKGQRAISAGYDLRIVYTERQGHTLLLLLRVGTHAQVY